MKSLFQNCILYLLGLSLCNIILFWSELLKYDTYAKKHKTNLKKQEGGKTFHTTVYKNVCKKKKYIYIYIYIHTLPSKSIGTVRPIPLFLLQTENIWVWHQKMNMRWEINISVFIYRYFHLDLIHNLENSTFCLNPPIAHVTKSIGTCDWQVCFVALVCPINWLFKQ